MIDRRRGVAAARILLHEGGEGLLRGVVMLRLQFAGGGFIFGLDRVGGREEPPPEPPGFRTDGRRRRFRRGHGVAAAQGRAGGCRAACSPNWASRAAGARRARWAARRDRRRRGGGRRRPPRRRRRHDPARRRRERRGPPAARTLAAAADPAFGSSLSSERRARRGTAARTGRGGSPRRTGTCATRPQAA